MHETTVRFTDELWASVQQASRREGTSAAQYVRDATLARVTVDAHVASVRREVDASLELLGARVARLEETLRRNGLR